MKNVCIQTLYLTHFIYSNYLNDFILIIRCQLYRHLSLVHIK